MYDVACLLVTTVVSYYGRERKARWLGTGLLVLLFGNFIFILPHFIIGSYQPGEKQSELFPPLCNLNSTNNVTRSGVCDSTSSAGQLYPVLFCIGMLVIGIGGSPIYTLGVTYLDESVKKKASAIYVGIFSSASIVGAAIGFVIGGVLLSTNVDFGMETRLTPKDPRWIGNWWFGSFIVIMTSLLLFPWMFGFPRVLPGAPGEDEGQEVVDTEDDLDVIATKRIHFTSMRDLLTSTKMLFTSPSYVLISIGISTVYFEITSSTVFLPKLTQVIYNIPASRVSIIFGMAIIIPVLLGQLLGSYLVKRLDLGAAGALKAVCITMFIGMLLTVFYVLSYCENPEILGLTKKYGSSSFQAISGCDVPCDCKQWKYLPVCDGNTTFTSPCHARCSTYFAPKKVFQGCSCTTSQHSQIKLGKCPVNCGGKMILFIFLVGLSGFILFFVQTPIVIAILRSVPYHLIAYAMGWQLNFTRILGSIPGPIIYGKLIDTACIQWQETCNGKGSCQEYNHWKLILIIVLLSAILKLIAFISFLLAWTFLRKESKKNEALANGHKIVLESSSNNETDLFVSKSLNCATGT